MAWMSSTNESHLSVVTGKTLATSLGLLLIDPVMTSELHLDLFRTLGCRRAFFIGENPGVPNNYDLRI